MKLMKIFGCVFILQFCTTVLGNIGQPSPMNTQTKDYKLAPCQACKTFIGSFKTGMEKTSRGMFSGGDAHWEEQKLKNYTWSEIRLVEIMENICKELDRGRDECLSVAENSEQMIEEWWNEAQKDETDLYDWLCIARLQSCCPRNHFGRDCKQCPGFPERVCNNNGKCIGQGTRKGSGKCNCNKGYSGEFCDECSPGFFESYRDDKKLLCSECHQACSNVCSQAGPKGCTACKSGWIMDTEKGCIDEDECLKPDICKKNQFCVNNDGSFVCLACDHSCSGCHGDGPDMCIKCADGFILKDNICQDDADDGRIYRYLTYLGLSVATAIIFQKNMILASIIGLCVALYVSLSEYMLNSEASSGSENH